MADELSQLGVNWVEESALRNDVEADVEARADAAAVADEAELRKRWAALEETECAIADIQQRLSKATAPGGLGGRKDGTDGDDLSVLQFSLLKAQRELESRMKALREWQVQSEVRRRRRVEEAKQRKQAAGSGLARAPMRNQLCAVPGVPLDAQTVLAGHYGTQIQAPLPAVPAGTSDLASRVCTARAQSNGSTRASSCASSTLQPTFLTPSRFRHLRSTTVTDVSSTPGGCSGGSIPSSSYRVTLTPSDVRSKLLRYVDDSDLSLYNSRCRKRKRLEGTIAGLEVLEVNSSTADTGVKGEDGGDQSGIVKCEGCCEGVGTVKRECNTHEKAGTSPLDAIDVDALMEEPGDAVVEVLKRVEGLGKKAAVDYSKHRAGSSVAPGQRGGQDSVEVTRGFFLAAPIYQKLLAHQRDGLVWLLNLHRQRVGGILGDDMGLGKTIQIAVMLNALSHSKQLKGPCLIVTPVTVLRQWVAEMHRWAPYMRTCVMHASSASTISREQLIDSVRDTPAVLLTTYAALRDHCRLLHGARFQYVILDEGHKIGNPEATVTVAAKSFPTPHRLILSGTPVQNTLKELWCLFDFVKPGLLGTLRKFEEEFEDPINASKNIRSSSLALATAAESARVLHDSISPFLLRRLKRQVMADLLPEKYERVIRCPLSDSQLQAYVELLTSKRVQKLLSSTMTYTQMYGLLDRSGRDASGSLHVAGRRFQLMREGENKGALRHEMFCIMHELRRICNHVDIFLTRQEKNFCDEDDDDGSFFMDAKNSAVITSRKRKGKGESRFSMRGNGPVDYDGSSKLDTLRRLLKFWQRGGQRALVFSQTRAMLDIIENMCEQEALTYIRMDGTTSSLRRQELMDRFNEDSRIAVALLTTRVGGVGVNLIGADRVVIFDPDWNPVTDEQARERAWRIGQTRDVGVYRLISSGTVEEAVLRRQLAKTYVTEKVLHDPTLQRFFYEQGSMAESFYLGSEYDARVPPGMKHILAAQELFPLLREESDIGEALAVTPTGHEQSAQGVSEDGGPATVKAEQGSEVAIAPSVYRVCSPRECSSSATSDPHTSSSEKSETALLQDLIDGKHVRISGVDKTARRLACMSASQAMLRVSGVVRTIEHQSQEALARFSRSVGS